ncbi:hypothetical protein MNBD_GAMMA10-1577 [hydrothermal vent metagenome]|uniref:tRNA-uridine aminocarboxypropyltransferase n=1 Tax=hydrothermal vent metagenome TaxID=652676 RepID=A0A3B0Y3T4_9ZZZZ
MSRAVCYQCHRAKVACLCNRIKKHQNQVAIIVLQHPDEVKNPKASAIIAELGLAHYQCWVGEDFSQHSGFQRLIAGNTEHIALLYPTEAAIVLNEEGVVEQGEIKYLIVIDATWRKARKIWALNAQLQALKVFRLVTGKASSYRIRKVPEAGYLSTVESIVEGLRVLEGGAERYQGLLDLFREMIDFQIEKMGKQTWKENYKKEKE